MSYSVKECFLTLQGEGAQSGRAAVFVGSSAVICGQERRKQDRLRYAGFVTLISDYRMRMGAGLRHRCCTRGTYRSMWPGGAKACVFTGGEPMLQLTEALVHACTLGFEVAIETNGTRAVPEVVDWICVSPKANAPLVQKTGHELKLVYPQTDATPDDFSHLDFEHFFLQPMDSPEQQKNTERAVQYCQRNPRWRLSVQTHKWIGIQ